MQSLPKFARTLGGFSIICLLVYGSISARAADVIRPAILLEELERTRQIVAKADGMGTRLFADLDAANGKPTTAEGTYPKRLVGFYVTLAKAMPIVEGVIIESGSAPETHARVLRDAVSMLEKIGFQFSRAQPYFGFVMYGGGWDPVQITTKIQARTTRLYKDTFKKADAWKLSARERAEIYRQRWSKFRQLGGKISNIGRVRGKGTFAGLEPLLRYDYVLFPDGAMNFYSTDESKFPRMGHSVLANAGSEFIDPNVLLAGEFWVYKSRQGAIIAVVICNNSGHFVPEYADLKNAVPPLMKFGLQPSQIIVLGGPNNFDIIFRDAEKLHGIPAKPLLPKSVETWRKELFSRRG